MVFWVLKKNHTRYFLVLAKNQVCVLGILGFEKCRPFFFRVFNGRPFFFAVFFKVPFLAVFYSFSEMKKKNAGYSGLCYLSLAG